jgi:hypothetical protein
MAEEKEVARLVDVMRTFHADNGGFAFNMPHTPNWDDLVRAVLSAVPSYAQGFADAKRRAVDHAARAIHECLDARSPMAESVVYRQDVLEHVTITLRAIEPEKGTHEARWAAAGWPFAWDDDVRAYVCPVGEITGLPSLPTVQAVDAWIADHEKDKAP